MRQLECAGSGEGDGDRRIRDGICKIGQSAAADQDTYRTQEAGIGADEDRAAVGLERAASDVGVIEIDLRTAADGRDGAGVEEPAMGIAGDILEDNGAAVLGLDQAMVSFVTAISSNVMRPWCAALIVPP